MIRNQLWLHRFDAARGPIGRGGQEASGLARRLLGTALAASDIRLSTAQLTRPALELFDTIREQYAVEVSLAHCRGLVMAGLAPGPIGVDCERPGRSRDWTGMADLYFSAAEAGTIRDLPAARREAGFLKHWTLKESMVKATRGSVFTDLNRLVLEGLESQLRARTTEAGTWHAWQGELAGFEVGLVCAQPEAASLRVFVSLDSTSGDARAESTSARYSGTLGLIRVN